MAEDVIYKTISITDNGIGIEYEKFSSFEFVEKLKAVGLSKILPLYLRKQTF